MAYFDKYGVEYSDNQKILVRCPCDLSGEYKVLDGVHWIEEDAFFYCDKLTSVVIPDGVVKIKDYAFCFCSSLEKILLPHSVTYLGFECFNGCGNLKSITLPNSLIEIEGEAFCGCSSIESIIIPNGVKTIGDSAFSDCTNLKYVFIPKTVYLIGNYPFSNCPNLQYISVDFENRNFTSYYGALCHNDLFGYKHPDSLIRLPSQFKGHMGLPISLRTIEYGAFQDCKYLEWIVFHGNINNVYGNFDDCVNLKEILVPVNSKVRFSQMEGLKSVAGKIKETKIEL